MKQLLIVSNTTLNAAVTGGDSVTPFNLSGLAPGAITFFELDGSTPLAAATTKNFGIALGRKNSTPLVIPEVDVNTLTVTKALPVLGKAFVKAFTVPDATVGKEYTIIIVKKGTVPHERNTWTFVHRATATAASTLANALKKKIDDSLGEVLTTAISGTATKTLTITGKNIGEQWDVILTDELSGTTFSTNTAAEPTIGDKAYIQDLASQCAAGKGFTDTYSNGDGIYPGYPEAVQDLIPTTTPGAAGYIVYTLRFKVGRDSAKTRDERVAQLVHIAVSAAATTLVASLDAILSQPVLPNAAASSQSSGT